MNDKRIQSLAGYLSRPRLVGELLSAQLLRRNISPAALSRELDIRGSQLSQWLHGHEAVPGHHMFNLKLALSLDDEELGRLVATNSLLVSLQSLRKIVTGEGTLGRSLKAYPDAFKHVSGLCETMAEADLRHGCHADGREALYVHVSAALRVARDVERYLRCDTESILTPANIGFHLAYPSNYYLGFYLSRPAVAGAQRPGLADTLWESVELSAREIVRSSEAPGKVAMHAAHLIFRHGRAQELAASTARVRDQEVKRMLAFGAAFMDPTGPEAEGLAGAMMENPAFADMVIAFDGFHYRDFAAMALEPDRNVLPCATMCHYVRGLSDRNGPIRTLAAARLRVLLDRYGRDVENSPTAVVRLAAQSDGVIAWRPTMPWEQRLRSDVLRLTQVAGEVAQHV